MINKLDIVAIRSDARIRRVDMSKELTKSPKKYLIWLGKVERQLAPLLLVDIPVTEDVWDVLFYDDATPAEAVKFAKDVLDLPE